MGEKLVKKHSRLPTASPRRRSSPRSSGSGHGAHAKTTATLDASFKADFDRRPLPAGVTKSDAFGVYALSIFVDEPDLDALMGDALTGGGDDKKADFIFLDLETERAFIGQSYFADQWGKQEAKANKAASLATAVAWLFGKPLAKLPATIRQHASDLRNAIADGTVTKVYLLYAHNCHESKNVRDELDAAASSARAQCGPTVTIFAEELGFETLSKLFDAIDKDILVVNTVHFDVKDGCYKTKGPNWSSLATRVNGAAIHDLFNSHGDRRFSANIRSYLGVLKRKKGNINADIRNTVMGQPQNFWVFNNGITILTNDFHVSSHKLTVKGVSVINGAQTTGVLGECLRDDAAKTMVPCRFIKCGDPATIENIIAFNNTQNAVKSFDRRSNDRTQKALAAEFGNAGIAYVYRRSQSRRAPTNSIHVETVGQGLASFHGHLQTAIRQRSTIFDEDNVYDTVFPSHISAAHVYLGQCLLDAVDAIKLELRAKQTSDELTKLQGEYLTLLEFSTAKQFVVNVIGQVCDQIVGTEVRERHKWRAKNDAVEPDRSVLVSAWKEVLVGVLPKIARAVQGDAQKAVRSTERAQETGRQLADYLEGEGDELASKFRRIRRLTEIA
jgi:hypothetical protein